MTKQRWVPPLVQFAGYLKEEVILGDNHLVVVPAMGPITYAVYINKDQV